jgi:hypothetical protein
VSSPCDIVFETIQAQTVRHGIELEKKAVGGGPKRGNSYHRMIQKELDACHNIKEFQ